MLTELSSTLYNAVVRVLNIRRCYAPPTPPMDIGVCQLTGTEIVQLSFPISREGRLWLVAISLTYRIYSLRHLLPVRGIVRRGPYDSRAVREHRLTLY